MYLLDIYLSDIVKRYTSRCLVRHYINSGCFYKCPVINEIRRKKKSHQ